MGAKRGYHQSKWEDVLRWLPAGLCLLCFAATAQVQITEFLAANSRILADEDGSFEDWIEIQNTSGTNVNLFDWALTDSKGDLAKWKFPSTNLPPAGFIVVFASNKDRRTPGARLHTNFKLDAAGEYLALVRPDGTVATDFPAPYATQYPDISFGTGLQLVSNMLLASNAPALVRVPVDASLDAIWRKVDFEDQDWLAGTNGVGYETGMADPPQVSFAPYLNTSVQTTMLNSNASAYVRLPFVVTDPSVVQTLTLQMRYDDGFVAYLNGQEIARANAADPLVWNSAATAAHPDTAAAAWESFDVTASRFFLQTGTNVLALHGLNLAANNPDFLMQAVLNESHTATNGPLNRYFTQPSPGALNGFGTSDLGPIFLGVGHAPGSLAPGQSLVVTARVAQAVSPVGGVTMKFRVMFNAETALAMNDAGASGDAVAGDGVWSATIPGGGLAAGQLVRYYVTATDTASRASRWPIFPDANDSEQYLGTVVTNASIVTQLPLVQLFAADFQPVLDGGSARVALYHLGELYDNILISRHGQSSAGWPKNSFNLDFNSDHRFLYAPGKPRQKDLKLLSNYGDKTRMHTTLAYEKIAEAGGVGHFSFPVRVHTNGGFYGIEDFVEDADELFLERNGRDPNGALYKMYNALTDTGGGEKKTRTWESSADLASFVNNLNQALPLADRVRYGCDNLDLPQTVSYFATLALVASQDHGHKNYYLYRDSDGTGEWAPFPWDVDLTWGRNWTQSGGYFQDTFYPDNVLNFYPGDAIQSKTANRLYDLVFSHPAFRQMYLRRLRTLMDTLLKATGTPTNALNVEPRMRALADLMDPPGVATSDADLDNTKWGPTWGNTTWSILRNEVERTISTYLPARRTFLASAAANVNGETIPSVQPTNAVVAIAAWDYNPASGNQDQEYLELRNANAFAVDVSGWKLGGGVSFKLKPGTVIPAGASLYVSPNVKAFRARTTGPRGGQSLFVTGPYGGHLNAWGESLTLADPADRLVSSNSFVGSPSAAQRYLRVTEIMYNPSPALAITNDAQQFEFIELKNISTNVTLNLGGVRFTNGITFNFTGSAVTLLSPGQTVLLVRNQAMFTARYGGGFTIAGQFGGALDSSGEALRLEDAVGEKILEFAYDNQWYRLTDGLGFSLVIVDANAPWETWDKKSSWRASGALNGSPGLTDPAPPAFPPILVNEVLTHTDPPQLDSVELFNPTTNAVNLGGWFLTDHFYAPKKYRIAAGTTIQPLSHLVFDENQFNTGPGAFRFSELGEFVYLFGGDANTNLTGGYHGYDFGAAPNGVSFGRHTNSVGDVHFVLQSAVTLGTNNAAPRVGPLVISEIMYHPPDTNGADNDLDEFVELQNITATNVPLYDPGAVTNTWRLRNAVDFDFPTNQTLAAGARLLVVGFNPTNAPQLAAFRARFGVSNSVAVFGPWSGKLGNSGATLEFKQPGPPDDTLVVPFYLIDKVAYTDEAPWPAGADGVGNSLQRASAGVYGNDPANWFAAGVSAGRASVPDAAPTVAILSPTNGASFTAASVTVSVSASDGDGTVARVELFGDGAKLSQWTVANSNYVWAIAGGPHTLSARVTDNLGAVAESALVSFTALTPPPVVAITSPTNGAILTAGLAVNVTASATSGGGPASAVDFYLDGAPLGTVNSPFTLNWTASPPGGRSLVAVARDAVGQSTTSAVASVFVQATLVNPVLLPLGATGWRYSDFSTNPGANWFAPAFNDAGWSNGPAQLGFGDGDEATVVRHYAPNGTTNVTIYFRRQFVVPTLTGITNILLNVVRDDGVIVYANGTEVFRQHMPGGTVTAGTFANVTTSGADESAANPTNFNATLLAVGTNTLAAEVHQVNLTSSDISFDASLALLGAWLGPALLTQPTNQLVAAGSNAVLAATATGTGPLAYSWLFNHAPLGVFTNVLTLTAAQSNHAGAYQLVVSNAVNVVTSSVAVLTVTNDFDGDGLLDAWEKFYFGGLGQGAANDPDGDGQFNWQEQLAGTVPTNAASALRLEAPGVIGGNLVTWFTAVSNRSYTVQFRTQAPEGAWQKLLDVSAASTNRAVWFTNAAPGERYFRLVTPAAP